MTIEKTMGTDFVPNALRVISQGREGDALLGILSDGSQVETRVLSRIVENPDRIAEISCQLQRLNLTQHPGIRQATAVRMDKSPPTFELELPWDADPFDDRFDEVVSSIDADGRFEIASQVIDAACEAHRVGLYHGSFALSSILVVSQTPTKIIIDFTSTACSSDVETEPLSAESDLENLRGLMTILLDGVSAQDLLLQADEHQFILLSQLLHHSDEEPPTLAQWKSVLEPWLIQDADIDPMQATSVELGLSVGDISIESGGTIRPRSPEPQAAPVQLGRFELIEKIGQGGMGSVYKGIDRSDGEPVAIKILRSNGNNISQAVRRFRKEARLLADAQNEHVTRLIDAGEENGIHYLVMEFIDGIDLRDWLSKRGPLPEREALAIAANLSRALVEAHAREVVHRDVKPENVLLKLRKIATTADDAIEDGLEDDATAKLAALRNRPITDFQLKLTDFGIARHVNQSQSLEVTRAGTVLGTPKYMSPEQCKTKETVGPPSDIYSVGITMYQLLTGTLPFEADDYIQIAALHCNAAPPPIQKRNANITDAAARLVSRTLEKAPEDRFGDASQLLKEILKLLHGDASDIQAHPSLPEHDKTGLFDKTVEWSLQSKPRQFWPLVSNTERLNEAIGLPAVEYRTEKDSNLGIRRFGEFTLSGVKVAWEEHPFEWIEGKRMGILREFSTGPFKWFLSIVTLEPSTDGGTKLTHQVKIEPRNMLGRVLATIEADWKGFRNLDRVYRRLDRSIQGRLTAEEGGDAFKSVKPLGRSTASRIDNRVEQVIESGVDPAVAQAIKKALTNWPAQELSSIRPLALADQMNVNCDDMIDACLYAATHGLLSLKWDVLCPACRVTASSMDKLSAIGAHTHCEACDVNFQSNLGDAIELVFRAHPEIRDVNDGLYCIGGPEHSPHVIAQVRVEPGECFEVELDLRSGDYLIRGARLARTQPLQIQDSAAPSSIDFDLTQLGVGHNTPKLRSGRQVLTLNNDLDQLHVVRVERMIPRDDVVTATMISTNPTFRRLFPDQNFKTDNPIETETMSFVATCIHDVDDLYVSLGDATAYQLIIKHHQIIDDAVNAAQGAIVKTIGERVLAVFNRREQATDACIRIREGFAEKMDQSIKLSIAGHSGPTLVTTQNSRLDYFGGTVRAVTALTDHAAGDTLLTEAIYSDRAAVEDLPELSNEVETVNLPGAPETRVKRMIYPFHGTFTTSDFSD